jgi:transposase InsO family protein
MPWNEVDRMSLRREFVELASREGADVSKLCRRFGISRKTGYKWLARYAAGGVAALADESRRPGRSPSRTEPDVEQQVLTLRDAHPTWGGRKLRARLQSQGRTAVPSASTITEILRRHGRLEAAESARRQAPQRFEHAAPNELWQMDFKGHFPLSRGGRCHPLTLLDDHSRFALCLQALGNEQAEAVRPALTAVFRRYGLPRRILADNGTPWGGCDPQHRWTALSAWLVRLGVGVSHGRPYHPQTQGKEERFHRTLQVEVLRHRTFGDLAECQRRFDPWREVYNHERPHDALGLVVPASRYEASPRVFPERLSAIEYGAGDGVRRVQKNGRISVRGVLYQVGRAFEGEPVALRPTLVDGVWDVYYCCERIAEIDERMGARSWP